MSLKKFFGDLFSFESLAAGAMIMVLLWVGVCWLKDVQDFNAKMKGHDRTIKLDLESVDLQTQLNGSFTYGRGSIQEKEYYVVYEVQEDGGLVLEKYSATDTVLYPILDKGSRPYVEKDLTKYDRVIQYRMYIPKNSIEKKYDLSIGQ